MTENWLTDAGAHLIPYKTSAMESFCKKKLKGFSCLLFLEVKMKSQDVKCKQSLLGPVILKCSREHLF